MDLEFSVNNQTLKRTDTNKPVNWSDNYLTLKFLFETEDWNPLNKFCLLRTLDKLYRLELENDSVLLPVGVLTGDKLILSVYGATDELRITTNMVGVIMGKSGYNIEDISDIEDIEDIYSIIDSKASKTYVDKELGFKADKTEIPVNVSELTNDIGYLTEHQSLTDYYTKEEVDNLIYTINNMLSLTGDKTIIQADETVNLTVNLKKDGFMLSNATINIYEVK